MNKFLVYANCQGEGLSKTLLENSEFASRYEWVVVPPVQLLKRENIPEILSKTQSADLFIYQPISATANRPVELSSNYLIKQVKPGAITISFPSLYFDGYFPHLQELKGCKSVLNAVHDYFILYSFSIGLTIEQTIKLIQKEDLYPENVSIDLCQKSLNNLSMRESQFAVDIVVSEYIRNNYRIIKLFNQFNHPTRAVFKYLSEIILEMIGLNEPNINEAGISHLNRITTPIYRSTYNNLKLSFEEDFERYNTVPAAGLNQRKVIEMLFDSYRSLDQKDINSNILQKAPFVPELVELSLSCL